jgi:hypothetical protein
MGKKLNPLYREERSRRIQLPECEYCGKHNPNGNHARCERHWKRAENMPFEAICYGDFPDWLKRRAWRWIDERETRKREPQRRWQAVLKDQANINPDAPNVQRMIFEQWFRDAGLQV